jgi:Arabinose efflux permease
MRKHYLAAYAGLPKEVYILFASRIINCMGSFILPLLALILTQKLGMSKAETGYFSALLTLTQAPCLFLGGKLIDSVGRKKVLIASEVSGAFFYILCGVVPNKFCLIAFIVIASDLYVISSPAFDAMLADLTAPEERKPCFSLIYLGGNIGMTVSPILGGLLFQNHLSLLFFLDAATTLACTALIAATIPETGTVHKKIPAEAKQTPPENKESVFRVLKAAPVLLGFLFFLFFYDFTYSQWSFLLPLQFGDLYGDASARIYSVVSALNALTVILFTPLMTQLTRKFRPLSVIAFGGVLYFAAFIAFGLVQAVPLFLAAGVLFTFGEIITTINIGAFVADHSPSAYRGRINSFSAFLRGAAGAFGPLVMGRVISVFSYFVSWLVVAVLILFGASGIRMLRRKESRTEFPSGRETAD